MICNFPLKQLGWSWSLTEKATIKGVKGWQKPRIHGECSFRGLGRLPGWQSLICAWPILHNSWKTPKAGSSGFSYGRCHLACSSMVSQVILSRQIENRTYAVPQSLFTSGCCIPSTFYSFWELPAGKAGESQVHQGHPDTCLLMGYRTDVGSALHRYSWGISLKYWYRFYYC